ncbi:response regulator [Caballeronia novacaledonica]|uniref:response regulator n=1 Tax=Caballeronia novacaledonica TaxID=1544861 RepID=UPI003CCC3263
MTTVLLVDDDADNLRALRAVLESAGYNVVPATGGNDALFRLNETNPRVIVTDWQMPGMDGLEFCQNIRRHPLRAFIPIIMLSANVEPVGQPGCWSAFSRKPIAVGILLALVAELSANGQTTRKALLECGGSAMSRWQSVDGRVWP